MNDIRRSILWVIFGFSMILIWDQWQVYNGRTATFFPTPSKTAAPAAPSGATATAAATSPGSVPTAAAIQPGVGAAAAPASAPVAPRQVHSLRSDVLQLDFDNEGGSLIGAQMLRHSAELPVKGETPAPLKLLTLDTNGTYVAQTGLIGVSGLPTHKTPMRLASGPTAFADGQTSVEVRFESEEVGGVQLVKTYTVPRNTYAITVRHEVLNKGSAAVQPQLYLQLVRDGNKTSTETPFYTTFTGPAIYTDAAKFQKVEFADIDKNKATFEKNSPDGYVAMVQHYFASAWLLDAGVQRENFVRKIDQNLYSAGMITPFKAVEPGQSQSLQATLFVGPQEEKALERLAPGLELVKDYGWLTMLAKPLYWLMEKIHGFVGNWGWAIVLLVVLIKAAFYWLNATAYRSMAKMKAINPRIMEMRERLKSNPQQMQQEMMRIYKEEKVNPLGGCFPILIQIPVFIALYWVLLSSVEMRHAPWVGWIVDLSSPDPYFIMPLIMTMTTLLQTALNPVPPDPLQAKLMWAMPLIFSVMFFFFPAGLVLYWITNNVLSIAQQWMINVRMGVPPQFNLPKFK
jgi:YidC/Oxa1 family membrane protein insertase